MLIKQSSAIKAVPFFMVDAADHISGKTGLSPTVTISKNGAAFATPAGAVTEMGSGWYKVAPNATDSNTVGALLVHATGTGADPFDIEHEVIEATLAKGTDLTGFNDLSAAQVNAECDTALVDVGLTTTVTGRIDVAVSTRATPAQVDTSLTTYGALKPTVAGRTLDITTGGEAGIDWANIGTPGATNNLSATTIATLTNAPADSAGVTTLLGRISSTLFTGITSFKEWLGLLAGKQSGNATARTELRSTGAGSGTFDEVTDSQEAIRDRGDAAWTTGAGGDPWNTALPGAYSAGTAGNIIGNRVDAAITTRATPAQVQTELGTYGALRPTVAARTLDISVGGEAGVDWANIGSPATAQNLSATTISTSQTVGSVSGSVGSVTGAVGSVTGAVGSVTNPVTLTAAYDSAKTAATQASVNTIDDFLDTEVAAIKSQTDQLVFVGGKVEANAVTTPADMNAIADALLKRDWNSVSGEAAYSALNAFRMLRNVWATAGGTLAVKKEDGTTTAWSRPLTVDPTAQPIVGAS